jgi:uncharacterized membrane protein YuzA (DUF378 family)
VAAKLGMMMTRTMVTRVISVVVGIAAIDDLVVLDVGVY